MKGTLLRAMETKTIEKVKEKHDFFKGRPLEK